MSACGLRNTRHVFTLSEGIPSPMCRRCGEPRPRPLSAEDAERYVRVVGSHLWLYNAGIRAAARALADERGLPWPPGVINGEGEE